MRIVAILLWPFTWLYAHLSFVRGFVRLLGILVGREAPSSQEVATHWLILVGFSIEWVVLQRVVVAHASDDVGMTVGSVVWIALVFGTAIVILCLLFHQFVIFRNFSLPREAAHRRDRIEVDRVIQESIQALSGDGSTVPFIIDALKRVPRPEIQPQTEWRTPRGQKGTEIAVYALFGVLTGEAGYKLTVLHEHDPSHWTADVIFTVFGTAGMGWGRSLECAFLFCAALICFLVLAWDAIVRFSPTGKRHYGNLLKTFALNDASSLLFWLCLFVVVTPSFRFLLGERFNPFNPAKTDIGVGIEVAWLVLIVFGALYVSLIGKRFFAGLRALAAEPSYLHARFKEI